MKQFTFNRNIRKGLFRGIIIVVSGMFSTILAAENITPLKQAFQKARETNRIELVLPVFLELDFFVVVDNYNSESAFPLLLASPKPERLTITISESEEYLKGQKVIKLSGRELFAWIPKELEIIISYGDGGDYLNREHLNWFRKLSTKQSFKTAEPRQYLIKRVSEVSNGLLTQTEKSQILQMLREVGAVQYFFNLNEIGGLIGSPNRTSLTIGKRLVELKDKTTELNLLLVLYHESQHWNDLKKSPFDKMRAKGFNNKSFNALVGTFMLELEAYREQYKLHKKFSLSNENFKEPTCSLLKPDGTKEQIVLDSEMFAFLFAKNSAVNRLSIREDLDHSEKTTWLPSLLEVVTSSSSGLERFKNLPQYECENIFG